MTELLVWLASGTGVMVLSHGLAYALGKSHGRDEYKERWARDAEELADQRAKPTPSDQAARDEATRALRDRGLRRSMFDDA